MCFNCWRDNPVDLWILTGESGLNGHFVKAVFDQEPTTDELIKIDAEEFPPGKMQYTGWSGWEVTRVTIANQESTVHETKHFSRP